MSTLEDFTAQQVADFKQRWHDADKLGESMVGHRVEWALAPLLATVWDLIWQEEELVDPEFPVPLSPFDTKAIAEAEIILAKLSAIEANSGMDFSGDVIVNLLATAKTALYREAKLLVELEEQKTNILRPIWEYITRQRFLRTEPSTKGLLDALTEAEQI
jgi:hypothetical protein